MGILERTVEFLTLKQPAFFKMQMEQSSSKPHGRRFTDGQLMECLTLYYQGPWAYRHLRKQFVPPSPIRRRIACIQMKPGFQQHITTVMKKVVSAAAD